MYAVVEFEGEGSVEVVPVIWLEITGKVSLKFKC